MQQANINCPRCGAALVVQNTDNEAFKRVACPQCGTPLRVKFKKEEALSDGGATQLGNPLEAGMPQSPAAPTTAGCLMISERPPIPLHEGINTVGRHTPTSQATCQLPVNDQYLSRFHAIIEAKRLPSGQFEVTIRNDRNKNATIVNGAVLQPGDIVVLTPGTVIQMGYTVMCYQA